MFESHLEDQKFIFVLRNVIAIKKKIHRQNTITHLAYF